jgi:tRNA-dihydrouridine synthase A
MTEPHDPAPTPPAWRLSVAPMMDWTDRHCRMLHRQLSRRALLYTEMVTAAAALRGPTDRLLGFDPAERPLALQLGGSDPAELAAATRLAAERGFDEVNLNVGCPSDRVRSGAFGACLMRQPDRVAACVAAMIDAAEGVAVTVKCRIGVDEQEPAEILPVFLDRVAAAGARRFTIHARKAWLQGLSPKQNRDVPPLDHALVEVMKRRRPDLTLIANGGLTSLEAAEARLAAGLDGAMIGRAAYHDPAGILAAADRRLWGAGGVDPAPEGAVLALLPYVERERARGEPMGRLVKPMLGLFAGRPGARRWRRRLSEAAPRPGAGPELLLTALREVAPATAEAA